jgi:hypothetical protein
MKPNENPQPHQYGSIGNKKKMREKRNDQGVDSKLQGKPRVRDNLFISTSKEEENDENEEKKKQKQTTRWRWQIQFEATKQEPRQKINLNNNNLHHAHDFR